MNIFKEIENIAKQGYSIEYQTIDQIANGHQYEVKRGLIPPVTYTVYITRLSDSESLYSESFDYIEDCLKEGIKYFKKNLMS